MSSNSNNWISNWKTFLSSQQDSGNAKRSKRKQYKLDGSAYSALEPRQVLTGLVPFPVDSGSLYQIHGVSGNQGQLSEIDLASRTLTDIGCLLYTSDAADE